MVTTKRLNCVALGYVLSVSLLSAGYTGGSLDAGYMSCTGSSVSLTGGHSCWIAENIKIGNYTVVAQAIDTQTMPLIKDEKARIAIKNIAQRALWAERLTIASHEDSTFNRLLKRAGVCGLVNADGAKNIIKDGLDYLPALMLTGSIVAPLLAIFLFKNPASELVGSYLKQLQAKQEQQHFGYAGLATWALVPAAGVVAHNMGLLDEVAALLKSGTEFTGGLVEQLIVSLAGVHSERIAQLKKIITWLDKQ